MEESALHARLRDVVGNRSYRMLAEVTDTNPETARRYMTGHAPSTEFLVKICERFSINGEWLLTGQGPMHLKDAKAHALQQASAGELLHSLARAIEKLTERVDRMELFVQTFEARVWARMSAQVGHGPAAGGPGDGGGVIAGAVHEPQPRQAQEGRAESQDKHVAPADEARVRAAPAGQPRAGSSPGGAAADIRLRAQRVADAVPKRPREDAP